MSEGNGLGYIKGKVEGIEKNVTTILDTQTKYFKRIDSLKDTIRDLPCPEHRLEMDQLQAEVKENKNRSHGAADAAEEIHIKVRPIIEKIEAEEKAEKKTEERKWYQKTEIRMYIIGGIIISLLQWLPDFAKYLIKYFKGS